MPTYGRKKVKDMVRSVLPSTRGSATQVEKKIAKKAARSKDTQAMKKMVEHIDAYDDYVDEYKKMNIKVRGIVHDRRLYDKIAPLIRWAPKVTSGKHDERLAQLRSMMPDNTIGRHAITHVQHLDEFDNPNNPYNFIKYSDKRRARVSFDRAAALGEILKAKPWLHSELNKALKTAHKQNWVDGPMKQIGNVFVKTHIKVGAKTPRCLKGLHDVEAFVKDVVAASMYKFSGNKQDVSNFHPEWLETLNEFITKYK